MQQDVNTCLAGGAMGVACSNAGMPVLEMIGLIVISTVVGMVMHAVFQFLKREET